MTGQAIHILIPSSQTEIRDWIDEGIPSVETHPCDSSQELSQLSESLPGIQILFADHTDSGLKLVQHTLKSYPDIVRVLLTDDAFIGENLSLISEGQVFRMLKKPSQKLEMLQCVHQGLQYFAAGKIRQELTREVEQLKGDAPASPKQSKGAGGNPGNLDLLKNELLMIAAHDIRSPLSVIIGYTDVLLEVEDKLSSRGTQMVGRIHDTGIRLLTMVDQLLNISVMEMGKLELNYHPTKISEVIHAVEENLVGLIEEKKIDYSTKMTGSDDPVKIDKFKAIEALQNLLSNALKFSGSGGSVALNVAVEPHLISFSVADKGPGLTAEQMGTVFEKFSRFSTDSQPGSGLGLAIAKAISELHGGSIRVQSTPGQGSTFSFTMVPQA